MKNILTQIEQLVTQEDYAEELEELLTASPEEEQPHLRLFASKTAENYQHYQTMVSMVENLPNPTVVHSTIVTAAFTLAGLFLGHAVGEGVEMLSGAALGAVVGGYFGFGILPITRMERQEQLILAASDYANDQQLCRMEALRPSECYYDAKDETRRQN